MFRIVCTFFLCCLPTFLFAQVSKDDREELFERVEEMCSKASTSGEMLTYEGDLEVGAVLRMVGVGASGKVKAQQWENIQQVLGDERTDPTVCRFEMFRLILPLFEGVSDVEYAKIADVCQVSGWLRFCVQTQNLKLFGNNIRIPITIENLSDSVHNTSFQYGHGGGAILTDSGEEHGQEKTGGSVKIAFESIFSDVFVARLEDPDSVRELAVQVVLARPATQIFFDGLRMPVD